MRITDRLFSYPILCADKDDYRTCKFIVESDYIVKTLNSIKMTFSISMDCPEIDSLIKRGLAEYVIHIECPTTAYRKIWSLPLQKIDVEIPLNKINGVLERTAFIVAKENIENFYCSDWNDDFDWVKFSIKKGSMLAYQNFQKLNIEKNYEEFTNASSMFIVYKKPSEEGAMNIDLDSDYIKIGLNKKEYAVYELNNKNPQMQPILNAMVIFPALIYVFEELKQYGEDKIDYTGRKWYKSLVKSYQKRGENFEAKIESELSISLAQEAMEFPLSKAFANISALEDIELEDD